MKLLKESDNKYRDFLLNVATTDFELEQIESWALSQEIPPEYIKEELDGLALYISDEFIESKMGYDEAFLILWAIMEIYQNQMNKVFWQITSMLEYFETQKVPEEAARQAIKDLVKDLR